MSQQEMMSAVKRIGSEWFDYDELSRVMPGLSRQTLVSNMRRLVRDDLVVKVEVKKICVFKRLKRTSTGYVFVETHQHRYVSAFKVKE